MRTKSFLFSVVAIVVICLCNESCTKETPASLIIPSTYRYNSPNLFDKTVYAIDTFSNFRKITDTLGSFNRANNEISDSINAIIDMDFMTSLIKEINVLPDNDIELVFGRYDTLTESIIVTVRDTTKYTTNGNRFLLNDYPEFYLNINNSFLEFNSCNEFTLRSGIDKITKERFNRHYVRRNCSTDDSNLVIQRIISSNPTLRFDTISVEYVNFIFSRY